MNTGTEERPTTVEAVGTERFVPFPKQAGETQDRWGWVERSVWTKRMLDRLEQSEEQTVWMVCHARVVQFDDRPSVPVQSRRGNPLTGEPDAGDPPVRFGGRGRPPGLSLPLSGCAAEAARGG